ncbi:MAG: aryl-sulfate sulfotransferase [Bacteroidetes bacterium]|nr:aryl-sulfate sulfotransferase [Bacteroidota bacterium]MBS1539927.1 aryl-sulfate sulfotransferase [Bacteroidota bacterium]
MRFEKLIRKLFKTNTRKYVLLPLVVASSFFYYSCNKNEINIPENLSLAETKIFLLQQSNQNILISSVDSSLFAFSVVYENGKTFNIGKDYVKQTQKNMATWSTKITLVDNTVFVLPSIGTFNIADSVVVNPFGTAPLSALATITMPVKGKFAVTVLGKPNGGISITKTFNSFDNYHQFPILGLYNNYANQVLVQFLSAAGTVRASQTITLQTDAVPNKPVLNIMANNLSPTDQSIYSVSASGSLTSLFPMGFDQKGEIRWYYSGDLFELFGKLANGNLIVNSAQNLRFYHSPGLNEITMTGQLVRYYPVPNYQHHDVWEMPNGNLLVATNSAPVDFSSPQSREDMVAEISRTTGQIVRTINFGSVIDPSRQTLPSEDGPGDWMHLNRVMYTSADSSLLISSRSQCAIIKMNYVTQQIKWILGAHQFWNAPWSAYLLTPVDANSVPVNADSLDFWSYGQHQPWQLPNGNILMYDDGDYRNYYSNPNALLQSYSRGLEYKIDEKKRTVQLVWQYDNDQSVFTEFTGTIMQDEATNSRLIGYMSNSTVSKGATPQILQIDSQNNILFQVTVNLGQNYYRALKFNLYDGMN